MVMVIISTCVARLAPQSDKAKRAGNMVVALLSPSLFTNDLPNSPFLSTLRHGLPSIVGGSHAKPSGKICVACWLVQVTVVHFQCWWSCAHMHVHVRC